MWTWVDGAEAIATDGGFAVDDVVDWPVLTSDFDELLPELPAGVDVDVESAVDDDGDGEVSGTIARILMLVGRRRFVANEITATPAEHVQVLDLAGFLVELRPASAPDAS